jgi:homocysteine S-methyltransferase
MVPSQEYSGAYPAEMDAWKGLYDFHLERIMTFVCRDATWAKVDVVAFETLPVVREVRAVREVMKTLQDSGLRPNFWISCVFPNDDLKLPDGTTVEELVHCLLSP